MLIQLLINSEQKVNLVSQCIPCSCINVGKTEKLRIKEDKLEPLPNFWSKKNLLSLNVWWEKPQNKDE